MVLKKQREKFKDLFPILSLDHDTLPKLFVRNLEFIFDCDFRRIKNYLSPEGGGPRVVVSTAAFHARVRGSVPGLGGLKETKLFLPHPRVKVSIVGSLRDREVACSASDRQGSNFESCVWRTVSSQSSHHPQEVLLAQFSLYVHKGGLKPDSFHFYLSPEAAKSVACALVTSDLDYCIFLLYNLPDRDIERLQRVQNSLASVVCKSSRFSRSKPLLNFLHWLPVKYRIYVLNSVPSLLTPCSSPTYISL